MPCEGTGGVTSHIVCCMKLHGLYSIAFIKRCATFLALKSFFCSNGMQVLRAKPKSQIRQKDANALQDLRIT